MPFPRAHDDQLAYVKQLRAVPERTAIESELALVLESRFPTVVTLGAELAAGRNYAALAPRLLAAFERFLIKPATSDKGCLAKTAIATALYNLHHDDAGVFVNHLHYRQIEPVFGGTLDTAAELRGRCIMALARLEHPETLLESVTLLADPQVAARTGAVRALNMLATPAATALLRLRALDGEHDAEVLGEILSALLEIDPGRNLIFVADFFRSPDTAFVEAAALALGSSRQPEALELLLKAWNAQAHPRVQQALLLAIATTRTDAALKFLLQLVEKGVLAEAQAALMALTLYRQDERITGQLHQIVTRRKQAGLTAHYQQEFKSG